MILRRPGAGESDAVQAVWERSHGLDDPGGRPRGGWSVEPWSTDVTVLADDTAIVGVAAVRSEPPAEAVAARVALDLSARTPERATMLLQAAIDLACHAQGSLLRLFVPAAAQWAVDAARALGFQRVRAINHMLLPAGVALDELPPPEGIRFRVMRDGEEPVVLEALNRNWEGTWDFVPIRPEMLEGDLAGQRDGMLLAVLSGAEDQIVGTCHAVFDATDHHPDGDPRAWISNLTVDPEFRGRGVARALLLAGVRFLRARGAGSVTLGVDAGDPAPLRLYESVGFLKVSATEAWDKTLR